MMLRRRYEALVNGGVMLTADSVMVINDIGGVGGAG